VAGRFDSAAGGCEAQQITRRVLLSHAILDADYEQAMADGPDLFDYQRDANLCRGRVWGSSNAPISAFGSGSANSHSRYRNASRSFARASSSTRRWFAGRAVASSWIEASGHRDRVRS